MKELFDSSCEHQTKHNSHNVFILNTELQQLTSVNMEQLAVVLFLSTLIGNTVEDDITASSAEVFSPEGFGVTLSCNYSVKADNLQWYRQDPGSAPQFLLLTTATKQPSVVEAKLPNRRLTINLNEERNQVHLEISSAAVTDSAVYYCALTTASGGSKMYFGSGTKLTVESSEQHEPSFYKLSDGNTTVCLATDFSGHDKAPKQSFFTGNDSAAAVRIHGEPLFNQVALLSSEQEKEECREDGSPPDVCAEQLEPDEKVNMASLIILGLRLLFLKTIVFNVLMTLRLWISQ